MIYEFGLLIFNILTLYIYYIELKKLGLNQPIDYFTLGGYDHIVKSPVVMRIKPINHSNTIMISVELEGLEPFPDSENICVIGEPLHVAYI
jgi:hypothetical protein